MLKSITVNVTQLDIDEGLNADCILCPVARAIFRRLPVNNFTNVAVLYSTCILYDNNDVVKRGHIVNLPLIVEKFIKKFDNNKFNKNLKPFKFRLKLV